MPELRQRYRKLADRLGLEVDERRIERRGVAFELDTSFAERLDDDSEWRTASWSLWSCRIAVDQITSTYDVTTERESKKARNVYEVASRYGDRERHLIPTAVRRAVERLADKELECGEWVDDRFDIVLGLAEGLGTHFLGTVELGEMPFDRDNVWENARLAHFYASYKARPASSEKHDEIGRVKSFHTVDGKTSSRAILLPDFDWDAAQDGGCCLIPSRDHMVIGEPFGNENAERVVGLASQKATSIESPDLPFFPTIYRLGPKSVVRERDFRDDPYAPVPEQLPIVRLA